MVRPKCPILKRAPWVSDSTKKFVTIIMCRELDDVHVNDIQKIFLCVLGAFVLLVVC